MSTHNEGERVSLRIELDVDVRNLTPDELQFCGIDAEDEDYTNEVESVDPREVADNIAALFGEGSEVSSQALAGSNIFLAITGATVVDARLAHTRPTEAREAPTPGVGERREVIAEGPLASSRCPVCFDDKPHTHNAVEAVEMRGLEFPATNEAWARYWGRTLDAALINELDFLFKKARRALPTQPAQGLREAYPGLAMSDAELNQHYEASKRDVALVGSEIRQIIGELRWLRAALASSQAARGEG